MHTITPGLVLRATKTGEADRVLLILTPKHGVISAIAKGSLRLKSKLFSATGLFCYSEFELFDGKSMFVVDNASVKEVFWGVHESVEGMALGMYLAEITCVLSPVGQDAEQILRLLLNTFHLLGKQKRPPLLLKIIFELRALSLLGYLPALAACAACQAYDGSAFFFNITNGSLLCASCAHQYGDTPNLSPSELLALRHIMLCEDSRLFSFSLSDSSIKRLAPLAQAYVGYCLDHVFKTQDFVNNMLLSTI